MGSVAIAIVDPKMMKVGNLSDTDVANFIREFNKSINEFVNETTVFAERFITDHRARVRYRNLVQESARHIIQSIERGELQIQEAAKLAAKMRNQYLMLVRDLGTDIGRVVAQIKKKEGRTFDY